MRDDTSDEDEDIADDARPKRRRRWTAEENAAILAEFREDIKSKHIPRNEKITKVISKSDVLAKRSFAQIKSKVQYQIKRTRGNDT